MNRSRELAEAIAEDALTLAVLHSRELDQDLVASLREVAFPDNLGLLPVAGEGQGAWRLARLAMEGFPQAMTPRELDELAADFAAIYLTGAYGASPCESVWLDEDHLAFQGRMFELREIYRQQGLANPRWRHRPDDHLALQLEFIAFLSRHADSAEDWRQLARFLDEHLLRWVPDFAAKVARRSATPFYAGLAAVTAAWCERLRDVIAELLQEARPTRESVAHPEQKFPLHFHRTRPDSSPGA